MDKDSFLRRLKIINEKKKDDNTGSARFVQ